MEASVPVEISKYGFAENSGGPGRSRGGYALVREFRFLAEETSMHLRTDRRATLPYGLEGGRDGTPSWNIVNPGPNQHTLPVCPMHSIALKKGETFKHIQPGGGGHGDPLERPPEKVMDAVENEMLTEAYAYDVYGVIIKDGTVDEEATKERRSVLRTTGTNDEAHVRHFYQSINIDPIRDAPSSSAKRQ